MLCMSVFALHGGAASLQGCGFLPGGRDLPPFFTGFLGICLVMPDLSNSPWLQLKIKFSSPKF